MSALCSRRAMRAAVALAVVLVVGFLARVSRRDGKAATRLVALLHRCRAAFECARGPVPLDYDRPRRRDDLDRAHAPARDRPGAADRLAVPQPGRAGRLGRRLRGRRRPFLYTRRGARAVRPRRLRPARHHPQHPAALLRQPGRVGAVLHAVRLPADARGGAGLDRGGPLPRRARASDAAARSSTTCRPPTSRATSTCCAQRSATPSSRYAGVLLRLVPRRHVRQPVPRPRPGARRRRRARPDRVVDRPRRRGRDSCRSRRGCAATPARRRRSTSSSGCATRAATRCAFSGDAAGRFAALARAAARASRSRSRSRTARPGCSTTRS